MVEETHGYVRSHAGSCTTETLMGIADVCMTFIYTVASRRLFCLSNTNKERNGKLKTQNYSDGYNVTAPAAHNATHAPVSAPPPS